MGAGMVNDLTKACDWTHPALQVVDIPGKGLEVVSVYPIEIGDLLIVFGGTSVNKRRVDHVVV